MGGAPIPSYACAAASTRCKTHGLWPPRSLGARQIYLQRRESAIIFPNRRYNGIGMWMGTVKGGSGRPSWRRSSRTRAGCLGNINMHSSAGFRSRRRYGESPRLGAGNLQIKHFTSTRSHLGQSSRNFSQLRPPWTGQSVHRLEGGWAEFM